MISPPPPSRMLCAHNINYCSTYLLFQYPKLLPLTGPALDCWERRPLNVGSGPDYRGLYTCMGGCGRGVSKGSGLPLFVPRCRLFNIGPKVRPPPAPLFLLVDLIWPPFSKILDPPLSHGTLCNHVRPTHKEV